MDLAEERGNAGLTNAILVVEVVGESIGKVLHKEQKVRVVGVVENYLYILQKI
jgi:hypothetical protein